MSYLHLAMEWQFWKQVEHHPTPEEMQDVKDGYIDILRYYKGKFQRLNVNGQWEEVAATPKEWQTFEQKILKEKQD